jgi:surfactin synthase thioesterase subunit
VSTPWLVSWRPAPYEHPVLLCLPQAGAGCGQFRPWQAHLGPDISVIGVQLPGRENRWADPPPASVGEVVTTVADELVAALPPAHPVLVFGHSFGGLLGYEITKRLGRFWNRWPNALVVAGCRPPLMWVGAGRGIVDEDTELDRLLAERQLDASDLDEDSREMVFELLRQDARLSLSYAEADHPPLRCAVEAWGGDDDETVTPEHLDGWRDYTAAEFRGRRFPGGHYFYAEQIDTILPLLRERLADRAVPALDQQEAW